MSHTDEMQVDIDTKTLDHDSTGSVDNVPVIKLPNLDLAQWFFLLTLPNYPRKEEVKQKLMVAIQENSTSQNLFNLFVDKKEKESCF
jgi:hypothetical protein